MGQEFADTPSPSTDASHAPQLSPPTEGLKRLLPRHFKIIELALDGFSNVSIASMLGMTPVGVGIILRDARVQHELSRRRENVQRKQDDARVSTTSLARETLNELTLDAVETLNDVMVTAKNEGDLTNARLSAKHILDKAFGDDSMQGVKPTILVNIEQLNVLNQALRERGHIVKREVTEAA